MKLIILTVICMGIVHVKAECDDVLNDRPEGCYDEVDLIAKIECAKEAACVCTTPGVKECAPDIISQDLLDALTAGTMDGPKCKGLCEASKSTGQTLLDKCEYFRWEEEYDSSEHCSFMNSVQCTEFEPCTGDHCLSGRADCPGGLIPTGESCAAGADFVDNHVHWKCINPFADEYVRIDIYGSNPIPAGTMCFTDHKCIDFDDAPNDDLSPDYLYRTYVVECEDGKWVKFEQSNNDPTQAGKDSTDLLNGGAKLTDPECNWNPAEPLRLDETVLTESGVSLICSNGDNLVYGDDAIADGIDDGVVSITAPNTCALLCNFHHVMTIEPKFEETYGTTKWWKYQTGDDDGEEATRANVYCWTAPDPEPTTPPPPSKY